MQNVLANEILNYREAKAGCDFRALVTYLTSKLNVNVSDDNVQLALEQLRKKGLISVSGQIVKLTEPDRPEKEFHPKLLEKFSKRSVLNTLGVKEAPYVLQDTSTGGSAGHGQLRQPDITLAFVTTSRFNRSVELITFEVKNRRGANRRAVMDPVAHEAISHNPFLVCPNSKLEPKKISEIQDACANHNVGLIVFDVEIGENDELEIENLKIKLQPKRRMVSQDDLEGYIEGRLTKENCAKLESFLKVDEYGGQNS